MDLVDDPVAVHEYRLAHAAAADAALDVVDSLGLITQSSPGARTAPFPRGTGLTRRRWIKALRTNNAAACVEVMIDASTYHIRDSKDAGHGHVLTLSTPDWYRLCDILLAAPSPFREQPVDVGGLRVGLHVHGHLTIQPSAAGPTTSPR